MQSIFSSRFVLPHWSTVNDMDALPLSGREIAALDYAKALTRTPDKMRATMIDKLRKAGFTDGEILEINQVTAYFSYANRTVTGLGCSADGDILDLSPVNSDDPNDWGHG